LRQASDIARACYGGVLLGEASHPGPSGSKHIRPDVDLALRNLPRTALLIRIGFRGYLRAGELAALRR
jgi:hypothetical protein